MVSKSIRNLKDLLKQGFNLKNIKYLEKVSEQFSISLTPHMQELIDKTNANDPIAKQFLPHAAELNISPLENSDPIGDNTHTKVKGIVHRYPDRCLFTPVHICPVYCRFCFRREKVSNSSETLTPAEIEQAFLYIKQHPEIWEVIITGGDPLILRPKYLKSIIQKIAAINHVEIIRIHTRIPLVDPNRVNLQMVDALKCGKPVYIILHANHPKEFTDDGRAACSLLVDSGFPMLSQTVLLKDINDNIEILSNLMKSFIKNRIKPYYLHQGDLAKGTSHFRISIETGQKLMQQLRGRFSGLCQPEYVLDIPGGHGKVPIADSYIKKCEHKNNKTVYTIVDYLGNEHEYEMV